MLFRDVGGEYCIEVLGKRKETWCGEVIEKSVVEKCCRRSGRKALPRSVVQECWRRVLWSGVGEECSRGVGERLFGEVLGKSVTENCCISVLWFYRKMLEKSGCKEVTGKSAVEKYR